ncbi:phage Gp37/Gp68 family protein [uncultured Thalassospira sp.]|uniref:DUF5131 family protein n=1 Tax=uncultured Thalassospira sp. TaxID=404382 RepID=UPI0030D86CE0|tara:strand:- start:3703 stop:4932 length:1230 start_codon:yes stop_codon:yes gene_type:complete
MTKIEWTKRAGTKGETWNPIRARNKATGGVGHFCTKVSAGCQNCYAADFQKRFKNAVRYAAQDADQVEIYLDEAVLMQPLHWKKPRTIFVCSMTDLFYDGHDDEWIDKIFAIMALCPQHIFIVLTKRPERLRNFINHIKAGSWLEIEDYAISMGYDPRGADDHGFDWLSNKAMLPNVWLGTSVEDQATANERIPVLLDTPAAVRFISAEPLLGPVDMGVPRPQSWPTPVDDITDEIDSLRYLSGPRIDWVIVGGESGRNARPMHPDWARSLRDQCKAAGTPFFFKQWGAWAPKSSVDCYCNGPDRNKREHPNSEGISWRTVGRICYQDFTISEHARRVRAGEAFNSRAVEVDEQAISDLAASLKDENRKIDNTLGYQWMYRVGKKAAGRLLDGREHNEWPATDQRRAAA